MAYKNRSLPGGGVEAGREQSCSNNAEEDDFEIDLDLMDTDQVLMTN